MTTTDEPVFVDTNILVYSSLDRSPFQQQARDALTDLRRRGVSLWISRQVLREYLSAMTRPDGLTGRVSSGTLVEAVRYFERYFHVAEDGPEVTERLLTLVSQVTVEGRQIHDANVVATMLAHGIPRLLTHNTADFARYSAWITLVPL